MPTEQMAPYVFLSYASADREWALRIADLLEAQRIPVWMDRHSIEVVRAGVLNSSGASKAVPRCSSSAQPAPWAPLTYIAS